MRRQDRQVTDPAELKTYLEGADSCHLALVDGQKPYLVTLNFGFEWTGALPVLYFHSAAAGRKIDILRTNPEVCFSLDLEHKLVQGLDDSSCTMHYKSLVGTGAVTFVTDPAEKKAGMDCLMGHYSAKNEFNYPPQVFEKTTVLRLDVAELQGKKRG